MVSFDAQRLYSFDVVTGRDDLVCKSGGMTFLCKSSDLKCSVFLSSNRRLVFTDNVPTTNFVSH